MVLLYLCLLSGASAAIAETALGFSSPLTSRSVSVLDYSTVTLKERGELSLWRVNDRSMIGLGIGLYFSRGDDILLASDVDGEGVYSSLTAIQTLRPDKFAPLSYQRVSATLFRVKIGGLDPEEIRSWTTIRSWSTGVEIGIGVIWRPLKNISLSLQQGALLRATFSTYEGRDNSNLTAHIQPLRLLAFFSLGA